MGIESVTSKHPVKLTECFDDIVGFKKHLSSVLLKGFVNFGIVVKGNGRRSLPTAGRYAVAHDSQVEH